MNNSLTIDLLSCVSILVEPLIQHLGYEEIRCGPATAFVVHLNGRSFLVTNYHVVSGRWSTDNAPVVLINATTTGGMSGSPVFQIEDGSYIDDQGGMHIEGKRVWKFLGIYSGRITEANLNHLAADSCLEDHSQLKSNILNIGLVWKPLVINKLIENILLNDRVLVP